MEPGDDRELHDLLKEWRVAGAPRSLDERVLQRRAPSWRAMLTGSIRIPVPMALAAAAILFVLTAALLTRRHLRNRRHPPSVWRTSGR
jgi:hypothetical protein